MDSRNRIVRTKGFGANKFLRYKPEVGSILGFMGCLFTFFLLFSVSVSAQEKPSKKKLRAQRKEIKLKEQHLKLIEAVKDSNWNYFPYEITSSTKMGNDGGMFTFKRDKITLFNVFIPNAKNTGRFNRIEDYYAPVSKYGYEVDGLGNILVSLVFEYQKTEYSFVLEKIKSKKWATLRIFQNGRKLATYEGPLKE